MVYGFNRSMFVMTLILDWSSKQAFTAHLKTCHISSELVWKGLHQEEEQVVSFFFLLLIFWEAFCYEDSYYSDQSRLVTMSLWL